MNVRYLAMAIITWALTFVLSWNAVAQEKIKVGVLNVASINAWISEAQGFWKDQGRDPIGNKTAVCIPL